MADIQWIKITTDMFDNRKIKQIRALTGGNNIVLFWIMLLTIAGRCNANGKIFLTENIPYTTKMLAEEIKFKENFVKSSLKILEDFGMVEIDNNYIFIINWEEYQNVEGMDKIREQTRKRVEDYRARKKKFSAENNNVCNVTCNATVTLGNATDKEEEKELEKECFIESAEINNSTHAREGTISESSSTAYGEFKNVFLSDDELSKLKKAFPDWSDKIERLSSYIKSSGKSYVSHYATIKRWAKEDAAKEKSQARRRTGFHNYSGSDDINDFEKSQIKKRMNAEK